MEFITNPALNISKLIKVIGLGGGGSNAVNHMYNMGIKDVDFIVCNTDAQALNSSPIPTRIYMGTTLTGGRGAGSLPEVGRNSAIESIDEIIKAIGTETKMVFITAGMGGGTGTGAAPVVAKACREKGILTVGIVTMPFKMEGGRRIDQAQRGLEQLKAEVDTIMVISNDRLREIFGNMPIGRAFGQADNILATAAKGIAEIITVPGYVNVDFADVETVLRNSGVAIMGSAIAEGEGRAMKAIEEALSSPLLSENDITGAKNILLNITSGTQEVLLDEITEITDYIQSEAGSTAEIIWGNCNDETIGEGIRVTVIATGFEGRSKMGEVAKKNILVDEGPSAPKQSLFEEKPELEVRVRIEETNSPIAAVPTTQVYPKYDESLEIKVEESLPTSSSNIIDDNLLNIQLKSNQNVESNPVVDEISAAPSASPSTPEESPKETKSFTLEIINNTVESSEIATKTIPVELIRNTPVSNVSEEIIEETDLKVSQLEQARKRLQKLRELSNMNGHISNETVENLEKVPAYERRQNVNIVKTEHSSENPVSRYTLTDNTEGKSEIRAKNPFLHNKAD